MLVMPDINPEILVWARLSAGLSMGEAAGKIGLKETKKLAPAERLMLLEQGDVSPTRPQLVKMAAAYHRPLLAFYLQHPPQRADRGEDFRTLPAGNYTSENALIDALVRNVRMRQSIIQATLKEEGESEALVNIGSMRIADGVAAVTTSIVEKLHFNLNDFRSQPRPEDAFKFLRNLVESSGVFVLLMGNLGSHHTSISVQLFRGFAIADEIAPVVVINDQDAKTAWSFTLLHELTHLWLGQTGVSGANAEAKVEKFCNDVASQILLQTNELTEFSDAALTRTALTTHIAEFARGRHLSQSMVAYKLYREGFIDHDSWASLSALFRNQWIQNRNNVREQSREAEGGPNYYVVKRHKVGPSLIQFAKRMLAEGAITTTKAGKVLDVKPQNVHQLISASNGALKTGHALDN